MEGQPLPWLCNLRGKYDSYMTKPLAVIKMSLIRHKQIAPAETKTPAAAGVLIEIRNRLISPRASLGA